MIRGNTLSFGGAGSLETLFAVIAVRESGWIAAAQHAVGSYLIAEEKLFRVKTYISAGDAIRPGENVVQTTLLEALHDMIQPEQPVIEPRTITENGTYTLPAEVDGFGPVTVAVAMRTPRCEPLTTFDWGQIQNRGISWPVEAINALALGDDTTFGG